ncbi:PspC domain-containing protein [Periweissella fabalis]|uniref:PspC domain-containing protein n=1 Tax=Periweissella fabalis TaxID=1070421 RepID=A0A7X6N3N8_9LACO|nr:PspC domain-containing protein [Periweissella fabalis]MCM0599025.1 PspC domain-containing protein [Periweissella fabalis]NKZ23305.1 PspC domain-containing protein [Periweissella fabalis]
MHKRLFRSNRDRVWLGVLGGFGEYLNVDPTLLRVIFVIFGVFANVGALIIYVLCAWLMPKQFD